MYLRATVLCALPFPQGVDLNNSSFATAAAHGLPIITTPAGDAGVIVEHGVTGYVVAFDDVKEMAANMVCLAQKPELRRQMGMDARQRVEQHYNYAALGDRLLNLYRQAY